MLFPPLRTPTLTSSHYTNSETANLHVELVHRLNVLQIHNDFVWYKNSMIEFGGCYITNT
jgi:hypothetical protein